jgi:hypothetical protein
MAASRSYQTISNHRNYEAAPKGKIGRLPKLKYGQWRADFGPFAWASISVRLPWNEAPTWFGFGLDATMSTNQS